MNDSEKFKKFFGFGSENDASEIAQEQPTLADSADSKESLEKALASAAEWTEKYVSLSADFQNYKKRIDHERVEWSQEAQRKVFLELLEIIDNFERALDVERKRETTEGVAWLAGFEMIYQSLEKLIHSFGVKEITDFSVFNPKYHEALMQVESADHTSGEIVQVLQKGYVMNDKVIRPATVSVAQ
jgi:molecular chaperone GrpE